MARTRKTRAQLLELLQHVEWVMPIYNGSDSCSCCGNMRHWGHSEDCELNIVLRKEGL